MTTPDFLPTGISRLSGPPPGGSALLAGAEAQSAQVASPIPLPVEPPALPASPLAPDVAPPLGLAPAPNDLRNVPSSLGGALSLVPFFTTATRPPSSSGFYFLDEASTVSAAGKTPFQFASISVVPELVEQHPNRPPELGFGTFGSTRPFDPRAIHNDFPILREQVNGRPLIWLDNAATTQMPQSVIDRRRKRPLLPPRPCWFGRTRRFRRLPT